MSNIHALASDLSIAAANTTQLRPLRISNEAANESTATSGARPAPAYSREPFETEGPATCLVWF